MLKFITEDSYWFKILFLHAFSVRKHVHIYEEHCINVKTKEKHTY